jgi:hypothetical protein
LINRQALRPATMRWRCVQQEDGGATDILEKMRKEDFSMSNKIAVVLSAAGIALLAAQLPAQSAPLIAQSLVAKRMGRLGLGCGRIRRRSPDRKRARGAILLWRLLSLLLRGAVCWLRILWISGLQWRISRLLWQLRRLLWPLPPVLRLAPGILLLVGDEVRRDDGGLTVIIVLDRKCY